MLTSPPPIRPKEQKVHPYPKQAASSVGMVHLFLWILFLISLAPTVTLVLLSFVETADPRVQQTAAMGMMLFGGTSMITAVILFLSYCV